MNNIGFEVILIVILVIANGVFSMSELAVVTARRPRLQYRADQGSRRARVALDLAENPDQFLSTIQIGITLVGTLAGAFGGLTISEELAAYLKQFPWLAEYADGIAFGGVVLAISFLSLVLGELVPKRVALTSPERIAVGVAPLMQRISRITSPAVSLLSWSTNLIFRLIPIKHSDEAAVTEEEIKSLIEQGARSGTVHETEQDMVEGVFRLGDRRAYELMTPRIRAAWIDVAATVDEILAIVREHKFYRFPVTEGSLDHVLGVVHVKDALLAIAEGQGAVDLRKILREPLFVPETAEAFKLMDMFRSSGAEMALVVDEHGGIQGVITMADIVESIVGDFRHPEEATDQQVVQRSDGSWLVDGMLPITDLEQAIGKLKVDTDDGNFSTVGGLVMTHLGRVPSITDKVDAGNFRFEVVDMDGNRVDKVLVKQLSEPTGIGGAAR